MNLRMKNSLTRIEIYKLLLVLHVLTSCSPKVSIYFSDSFDGYKTSFKYYTETKKEEVILKDSILKGHDALGLSYMGKIRFKSKIGYFKIEAFNESLNRNIDTIIEINKPSNNQKILLNFDSKLLLFRSEIKVIYLDKSFRFI